MVSSPAVTDPLYHALRDIIHHARTQAYRSVNRAMVEAYWNIGRLIVEEEQAGKSRAGYGTHLLEDLALRLTGEFGRGFSVVNLKNFRQFYLVFPKGYREGDVPEDEIGYTVCSGLSWSHYRLLMRVESPEARRHYMRDAIGQNWSVRTLERQIDSLSYERLLKSQDRAIKKPAVLKNRSAGSQSPDEFIRDPYVLEFLHIPSSASYLEHELEQALIDKLRDFLMELGKGFSFVGRQYRISTETSEFYIDLVFYHYILKCFVLIDLKTGKLTHQDIGQMDMYVRLFEDRVTTEGDNPTIGIILCTEKDETVVRYSVLNDNRQLFASRYTLYLPSEQELVAEIEREREIMRRLDRDRAG
ncbi:PDDEXK nuclease domain-containing protein [Methanoregula sp. UBA64]|jgi:predicted nuclease of restriction endonuclease-like (RecB) superfamily|uniref:PDDEXK nuclease domain-containing protein n=1 Tax=Methanoregula sp. UBA64 TaxID=1915554 RepID=UPI0025D62107|nr:PDDEXK nuclease domain-containing protein [Methanoregula sp. UBA64]